MTEKGKPSKLLLTISDKSDKSSDNRGGRCTFILDRAEKIGHAFGYRDLLDGPFPYGSLRNAVMKLKRAKELLRIPEEKPARFILPEWKNRPHYGKWFTGDKDPIGGECHRRFGFAEFLERLDFGDACFVHDLRLQFRVGCCGFARERDGWLWSRHNRSFKKRFNLGYSVLVQAYDTGVVQVLVKCSSQPFRVSLDGVFSLATVLGEVRARLGGSSVNIPVVSDWVVVQWHYGKDAKFDVSGVSFHVTFPTWCRGLARLYVKHDLKVVRVEKVESPKVTLKTLVEGLLPPAVAGRDRSYIS